MGLVVSESVVLFALKVVVSKLCLWNYQLLVQVSTIVFRFLFFIQLLILRRWKLFYTVSWEKLQQRSSGVSLTQGKTLDKKMKTNFVILWAWLDKSTWKRLLASTIVHVKHLHWQTNNHSYAWNNLIKQICKQPAPTNQRPWEEEEQSKLLLGRLNESNKRAGVVMVETVPTQAVMIISMQAEHSLISAGLL